MEGTDFQEDNDSDDEFESKMKESYNIHKNSRPGSSSRPETASRFRDEHDRIQFLLPFHIYAKISTYLSAMKISKFQISSRLGEYPTFDKFKNTFNDLGLELSDDEVGILFKDNGNSKIGVIRMTDLYAKIIPEEEEDVIDTDQAKLKEEAEKLLKDPIMKTRQKSAKTFRPITGTARSGSASTKSLRPATASVANLLKAKKNYLTESKAKIENADKEIALTVDRCKKEFEYECLHKMGEANEIAQALEMPTTYRAVKKEDGTTKCHVYMNDHFVDEITLDCFLREWRKLKRKQKPAINLPTHAEEGVKNPGKVNKKTRQEELKKLLLETKELTNKLKEQLKVLEKRGVVANSTHSSTVVYSNNLF
ncbi:hypothetical protein SteCoe_21701 [Stentor coeruleus]|uniref:Uncharacterized protein n=1 Tax=Stentor coeruleus TaxID=5963 RepID=A0A1R2BNQ7_9CILI|nr:hypothetical protein SteCoe_21701 [Stentor coeruleus]